MVKNPLAKQEMPTSRRHGFDPLGQEDPRGREMANPPSILVWEIQGQSSLVGYDHGVQRVRNLSN